VDPELNISVASAFTTGGNYFPNYYNNTGNYEFQNYTSITHGTQFIKFGGRLRENRQANYSTSAFAGQFNFASIEQYQAMLQGIAAGMPLSQIIANGDGPIQFQINSGIPLIARGQFDAGLFVQDDWKLIPSMTLSLGLRYEIQDNIGDHGDIAPRIGYAWGIGGGQGRFRQPKTVIRAGSGYFYDRFALGNILNAERYNGANDLSYTITNPNFFPAAGVPIPGLSVLQAQNTKGSTIYEVAPGFHVPTQLQSAVGIDRQLPHSITLSLNYLNTRGTHTLLTQNINTPLPGTYSPLTQSGVYPYGSGIIEQYSPSGVYRQNQLIANINARINSKISLFGYYVYGHVNTDANGTPSNPYNLAQDYGRASYDYRHQANINGSIVAPWGIRFSPNIGMRSAGPYNIVTGLDDLGTAALNQRPAFLPSGLSLPTCPRGIQAGGETCVANGFVINPTQGMQIIPINYGKAYPQVNVNMRISRTWGFGELTQAARNRQQQQDAAGGGGRGPGFGQAAGGRPGGGGGGGRGGGGAPGGGMGMGGGDSSGRKYSLTAGMMFHNMFNTVNKGNPVGSLLSPLYGESTSLSGGGFGGGGQAFNRRIDLSLRFTF
jgi:hypothetical protein